MKCALQPDQNNTGQIRRPCTLYTEKAKFKAGIKEIKGFSAIKKRPSHYSTQRERLESSHSVLHGTENQD